VRNNVEHTDEIEARLSEWGRASRAAARPVAVPAALLAAPTPTGGGRTWLRGGGALALAALVAATLIGLPRYLHPDRTAEPPIGGVTSTAPARPRFQVVTFHGLSINVPSSWPINEPETCKLSREVVLLPGARPLCMFADAPSVAFVEFLDGTTPLGLAGPLRTTETRISGLAATRTDGFWAKRPAFAYTVPTLRASVRIVPALGQTGADLAGSLQVNGVDSHGCPAEASDVAELPRNKPPARPGAAETLVPGRPDVLRVCRYFAGRLEQGVALTGSQAAELLTVLAQLPAGLSRANPKNYSASLCATPAPWPDTIGGKDRSDVEAYRIEADYPSGNPVIVVVRLGLCGDLGASNGSRTGQRSNALWRALFHIAGNQGGIIPVTPAP
jgi:hypothetical protein